MNVIFLDFDGVINTYHDNSKETIENRIKILSYICQKYNASVVIEASIKREIDDDFKTDIIWVKEILELFKKYNINLIGKTPSSCKELSNNVIIPIWKENEIRLYLLDHMEIEHYCVIDDDDNNDLEKVKDHLLKTIFYSENPKEEGLLIEHADEVGNILKKENEIRSTFIKYLKK